MVNVLPDIRWPGFRVGLPEDQPGFRISDDGSVRTGFAADPSLVSFGGHDPYGNPASAADPGSLGTPDASDGGVYPATDRAGDPIVGRPPSQDPARWTSNPAASRYVNASGNPSSISERFGPFLADVRDFSARLVALQAPQASTVSGRVRLGAIASVQSGALPQALRTVRDRHPALDVEVSLDDSDKLLVELKAGRIDAAVLVRPQSGGSSRLSWQNLGSQPFVLLAPPGTSGTSAHELLRRLDLIRYDTALTGGQIAARYVAQLAPRARVAMEIRSIDAIVAMVSAGLGVSIVPQPRKALLDAHGVRELRLKGGPTRQIAFVRRRPDAANRNISAVYSAVAAAYA